MAESDRNAGRRDRAANRSALVRGPLAIRPGPDGPTLAGDPLGPLGSLGSTPLPAPFDLLLTDLDPIALAELADRRPSDPPASDPSTPTPDPLGEPRPPTEG